MLATPAHAQADMSVEEVDMGGFEILQSAAPEFAPVIDPETGLMRSPDEIDASEPVADMSDWLMEHQQWEAQRIEWEGAMVEYAKTYGFGGTGASAAGFPVLPTGVRMIGSVLYRLVTVTGGGQDGFYMVDQETFNQMSGETWGDRVAQVFQQGDYGPHARDSEQSLRPGVAYYLFPMCDGEISWEQRSFIQVPYEADGNGIELSCEGE